jgi:pimeloyl-[acyl-carrier protein] methyl ester esterase
MSRPTLVLLPGMDGTGDLFEPISLCLLSSVVLRRMRYPANEALSYLDLTALVAAQLPPRAVLLGESFSGPIAIALAARLPEQVAGLILCASFAKNPNPLIKLALAIPSRLLKSLALHTGALPMFGTLGNAALNLQLREAILSLDANVLAFRLGQIAQIDVRQQLHAVACPILYLHGARDRLLGRSALREIQTAKSNMQLITLDAPHGVLQTRPKEASEAIVRFVESIE